MYREIRADDAGIQEIVITMPPDDYALPDFGHGRKRERCGACTVDRPRPPDATRVAANTGALVSGRGYALLTP